MTDANVISIAAGANFAEEMVKALYARFGNLEHAEIFLPLKRAMNPIKAALAMHAPQKPCFLPRLQALGDPDLTEIALSSPLAELPPVISSTRRQMLMAGLILEAYQDITTLSAALGRARQLCHFTDQLQTEGLSFADLKKLNAEDHTQHWQDTLRFLAFLETAWPECLQRENVIEPASYRAQCLKALADYWTRHPPQTPVIIAGSTGSIPTVRRLMKVVQGLPNGLIILPAVDMELDEKAWERITPDHHQYNLKRCLDTLGIKRTELVCLPLQMHYTLKARHTWLSDVLRPAKSSHAWQNPRLKDKEQRERIGRSLARVRVIAARDASEEASCIALALREALWDGRSATLITPDRQLALRVKAVLKRWNITPYDSAGVPLMRTPEGRKLQNTIEYLFAPDDAVRLVSLMRSYQDTKMRKTLQSFTLWLREVRPQFDTLSDIDHPLAQQLASHLAPLLQLGETCTFADLFDRFIGLETLPDDISELLQALRNDLTGLPELATKDALRIALQILQKNSLTERQKNPHATIKILGPLEARMHQADLTILGGMAEGIWPSSGGFDVWMPALLREKVGLPTIDNAIGLSSHDFYVAAASTNVIMTYSQRGMSGPALPSRWLRRLNVVTHCYGWCLDEDGDALLAVHRKIDIPSDYTPRPMPQPRPPAPARPRRISVTRFRDLMRDPYMAYAKLCLSLKDIPPLGAKSDQRDWGNLVHKVLEAALKGTPLVEATLQQLKFLHLPSSTKALWQARMHTLVPWFESFQAELKAQRYYSEAKGRMTFQDHQIEARADLIILDGGHTQIIDFKTGTPPSAKQLMSGFDSQLPLTALIMRERGFSFVKGSASTLKIIKIVAKLCEDIQVHNFADAESAGKYWPGLDEAVNHMQNMLGDVLTRFRDEATPYLPVPDPANINNASPWQHLARVPEWLAIDGEDSASGGSE